MKDKENNLIDGVGFLIALYNMKDTLNKSMVK